MLEPTKIPQLRGVSLIHDPRLISKGRSNQLYIPLSRNKNKNAWAFRRSLARTMVFLFFHKRDLYRIDVRTVHGPYVWRQTSVIANTIDTP